MTLKNVLVCFLVFIIHSAHADETILSVNINDSRAGYLTKTVKSNDDYITSIDTLSIQVKKSFNSSEKSIITSTFKEDLEGNLLYFSRKVEIPNANGFDEAYVKNGKLTVKTNITGNTTENIYDVPPKGFLSQSAYLKELKSLAKRISSNEVTVGSLEYYTWNFPLMRFEKNKVSLHRINTGTDEGNWLVSQQKLATEEGGDITTSVYDHNWKLKSITTALLDLPTEFKLCNSECTDERVKPLNHLTALYIASPYKISDSTLKKRLRFTITGPESLIHGIPNTTEQKVKLIDGAAQIDICSTCGTEQAPTEEQLNEALSDNIWLDIHNPIIEKAVKRVIRKSRSTNKNMEHLVRYVQRHLNKNVQFIGYASASEALKSRAGDCTEYALVLTALARKAGYPARVAVGISYSSERFHGTKDVFIPHAWTQIWDKSLNRWVSYDAALGGFDNGHIAFGVNNGLKSEYFQIANYLHLIQVKNAGQVKLRRLSDRLHQ